jgi:CobQ-like glutamine amidotransferase family enzyme
VATEPAVGIGLVRPDLFGTYGDSGNATVLAQRLRWRGLDAEVVSLGAGDVIPPHVRVIVIGGGEDRSQLVMLEDDTLMRSLLDAIDGGAAVLGVCAGLQLLGREFTGSDGSMHRGLGILDCVSHRLDQRAVGECITDVTRTFVDLDDTTLTGFENHLGRTVVGSGSSVLGRVRVGIGNGDGTDGAVCGRVIGTYLHGPVLARNPALADHLLESVLGSLPELVVAEVEQLRQERLTAGRLTAGRRRRRSALSWSRRR